MEEAGTGRVSTRCLLRVGGVGVVAATWASFFPPARPSEVTETQGDTPSYGGQALNPGKGASPLCTPPGLRKAILLITIRRGY